MKLFVSSLVFAGLVLMAGSGAAYADEPDVAAERQVTLDQTLEWTMQNQQGAVS